MLLQALVIVLIGLCIPASTALAQTRAATTTALSVTAKTGAVTTVSSGTVITLSASVTAEGKTLTTGQVNFCDASAKYCTDTHVLGMAQLTSAGTATLKFRPGIGSHSYKAVFLGTNTYGGSSSNVAGLTVTGTNGALATTTTIAESGSWGNYALTGTVMEAGKTTAPTGTVSFLDASNGNSVLATETLGASVAGIAWPNPKSINASGTRSVLVADLNGDGIPDLVWNSNYLQIYLGNTDGTYTEAPAPPISGPTLDPITADFNGDGIPDLAVPMYSSYSVAILLGKGDGTFAAPIDFNLPDLAANVTQLVTADFNGDGIADLAVVDNTDSKIDILLGNGDGTFTSAVNPSISVSPSCVAIGDFNGDGKTDLAVADSSSDSIVILLGNGDGTFTTAGTVHSGIRNSQIAAADFNGDGKLDLAVAAGGANGTSESVTIFTGNGDGTFNSSSSGQSVNSSAVTWIQVADFNQDGAPDVVLADSNGNVSVLLNDGSGSFSGSIPVVTGLNVPYFLTVGVGDLNGDGYPDIVAGGYYNTTFGLYLTEPTETATASAAISLPAGLHQVDASYAGDTDYTPSISGTVPLWGIPPATTTSLTVTSGGAPVTSVAPGTVVTLTATVKAGANPVTAGQVNFCDASAAYCTDIHILGTATLTSSGAAILTFVPGAGTHSYKAVFVEDGYGSNSSSNLVSLTVGPAPSPLYSDTMAITESGIPGDYSLSATVVGYGGPAPLTGNISFLDTSFGNASLATASLGKSTPGVGWFISQTPSLTYAPVAEVQGDFNGDGVPDLALLWSAGTYGGGPYSVTLFFGTGKGTFTTGPTTAATAASVQQCSSLVTGDFNGDGKTDLAMLCSTNGYSAVDVTVMLSNGDGTFATPQTTQAYSPAPVGGDVVAGSMVAADFNGDGKMDLALVGSLVASGEVTILLGNGDGTFTSMGTSYGYASSFNEIATGDFNGDGIPDLVVANYFSPGGAIVLLGKGDGTFTDLPTQIPVDTFSNSIVVGDFNGDGKTDLAFGYNGAVGVYLGNGDGTFNQATGSPFSGAGLSLTAGDFNHDGKMDLAGIDNYNDVIDLFLGAGDGTFTSITTTPVVSQATPGPTAIVSADFNGDGVPDLAMLTNYVDSVSILLTEPTQTATVTANGLAPVGAGTHNVDASYSGDSNYPANVSTTVALTAGLAPLVITPAEGTYSSAQTVTITESVPGASIYYSAYGTVTTNGFVLYIGPIQLTEGGTETIQAYATETGYQPSNYVNETFTINFPPAPTPTFSLAAGVYPAAQTVTISDSIPGATIYYTTNGLQPPAESSEYTGPITVSSSETLVATAIANGYSMSSAASATYIINSSSTPFIYTVAGNDTFGYSGDGGPATFADLNGPQGFVKDISGNIYIADSNNNLVRKVAAGTGIITTIAGNGTAGYSGDGGPATSAELSFPYALALDSAGDLYISDSGNNVVRKVAGTTGTITTYAGNGTGGYAGDNGLATSAELNFPAGIAIDASGNLFIADSFNDRARKVDASSGTITTVAGTGTVGYSGDGGPATSAQLYSPRGVALDTAGNLYIADTYNYVIRKVSASNQSISTVAGEAPGGYAGDGGPATSAELFFPEAVAVDGSGNLYISDTYNQVIRKVTASSGIISTIAGNGPAGYCDAIASGGDGGPATSAMLCYPSTLQADAAGNVYVADTNDSRIRLVTASQLPPTATTAAPTFNVSPGTYASPQTVTISDSTPGASVYLTLNGSAPSTAQPAYNGPINVSGSVTITAVAVAPGHLPSSTASAAYVITSPPVSTITTVAGSGNFGATIAGGSATDADLPSLAGIALDSEGDIYFSEPYYNSVWEISAKTGNIEAVAGTGAAGYSGDGGPAASAQLNNPSGLALDSAGDLYIADSYNNRIREIAAKTGIITTFAGGGSVALGNGGPATNAVLNFPYDVALDSAGNVYIADFGDGEVRMVSASSGIISVVAGNGNNGYSGDGGPATSAALGPPHYIALDSAGNCYISIEGRIRKVTASTGIITTIAGNGNGGYSGDGTLATKAEVEAGPIVVDQAGNVYFSNSPNGIREVSGGTGVITTVVGNGYLLYGGDGGSATIAGIVSPQGIAFDSAGNLYIADNGDFRIRKVSFFAVATPVFNPAPGTYTSAQTVTITDATQSALIYYTTDGSIPTTSSTVYNGSISVSQSTTLKAIAVATGYAPSAVASAIYTIVGSVTPTVSVQPSSSNITSAQALTVTVGVSGGNGQPTPTGSVTLSTGSYSAQQALSNGSASFTIPADTLAAGSNTLSVAYSGDPTYSTASGNATVTVSQVVLIGTSPSAVAPGGSATATVTLNAGSTYSGTMNLTCALASSPSGAQSLPTCSLSPSTVTIIAGGTATSTLTIQTTASSSTALLQPSGNSKRWLGGEGAALALVLLFGIPTKRRRWMSWFFLILLLGVGAAAVGCGGGGSQGSTPTQQPPIPATTAGSYTFTVTATDASNPGINASSTVTITVE